MQNYQPSSMSGYFKIRIDTIFPGVEVPFDIHLKVGEQVITYLKIGQHLTKEKKQLLESRDSGSHFYLKDEDRWAYRNFMKHLIQGDQTSIKEKSHLLRESALTFIEEMFEQPDVHKALDDSKPLIQEFISLMDSAPDSMADLISLSSHDFYTYNHSLDVAIYSLGLAKALGFKGPALEELGQGALFHDIGKRLISLDILCKTSALTEEEWAQMQMHPQFGLDILISKPNISPAIIASCYEHHESWSGMGYPQKLKGEEIHPYGRLIAITDTFDAMTTQRSYNVPLTPIDAVTMMRDKLKGRYDPEMIKAMSEVLFQLKSLPKSS